MSKYCNEPAIYIPETGCEDCSQFADELVHLQDEVDALIVGKQDKLTAGSNIQIQNDTISAEFGDATTSTAGLMSASDKTKLDGIQSGAEANVQSDWNEADTTSDAYILNKPNVVTQDEQGNVEINGEYTDGTGDVMTSNGIINGGYNLDQSDEVEEAWINWQGNRLDPAQDIYNLTLYPQTGHLGSREYHNGAWSEIAHYARMNGASGENQGDLKISGNYYTGNGRIGERISAEPSSKSCTSGRYYNMASITLTPGVWLIVSACEFASSGGATGVRRQWVVDTSFTDGQSSEPTGGQGYVYSDRRNGIASNPIDTHGTGLMTVTANKTLYLVGYQNSGSAISVVGRLYAVRIA